MHKTIASRLQKDWWTYPKYRHNLWTTYDDNSHGEVSMRASQRTRDDAMQERPNTYPCPGYTCDARMQLLPCPCDLKQAGLSETPPATTSEIANIQDDAWLNAVYWLCLLYECKPGSWCRVEER